MEVKRRRSLGGPALFSLVAIACGEPREGTATGSTGLSGGNSGTTDAGSSSGPGGDDGESGSGGPSSGDSSGGGDDTGNATTGGVRFDVPSGETEGSAPGCDDPDAGQCGCTGVDILFVVDNSASMSAHQAALGVGFPALVDAMFEALPEGVVLHVGVTSTEMGYSASGNGFSCPPDFEPQYYVTPDRQRTDPDRPVAQGRLHVLDGRPYYEIATGAPPEQVDALKDWFGRAACLGTWGSNVEMATGAASWVGDPAVADVNAGFIRDEGAVLVVFFMADEPDQTTDDPAAMIARLAQAKAQCGGTDCIVGGGLIDTDCMTQTPMGDFLNGLGEPPVVDELPMARPNVPPPPDAPPECDPEGSDPEHFARVMRDALAQLIIEKCEQIPPAG